MNYGIGAALNKAYSYLEDPSAKVQREQQVLGALRAKKMQDDELEKKAQQDAAAYKEQVSKFADELLGPDKKRINEKSRVLSMALKEKMKQYGNTNDFMSNGGISMLNDYKSEMINSDEANIYKENKKNAEKISDAYFKKMGHLLNQRDKKSFEDYQRNGGGIITFSGLLNEIEMPDPKDYDRGEQIPVEDVLNKNYVKILGNYALDNPDAPYPPSKTALMAYTSLNYNPGKGTDYMRRMQEEKHEMDKIKTAFDMDIQRETHEANLIAKALGVQSDGESSSSSSSGGGGGKSKSSNIPKHTVTSRALQAISTLNKGITQISDIPENGFASAERKTAVERMGGGTWSFRARGFNPEEKGFRDVAYSGDSIFNFNNEYQIRGGVRLLKGMENGIVGATLLGSPDGDGNWEQLKNNKILDFNINNVPGVYLANGQGTEGMELDYSNRNYDIMGIVSGYKVSNKDGRTSIVMDAYDGKEKVTNPEIENNESTPQAGMFITLRDNKGNVFYVDTMIDNIPKNNIIGKKLGAYNDLGDFTEASETIAAEESAMDAEIKAKVQPMIDLRNQKVNSPEYAAMYNEAKTKYSGKNGLSPERMKLIEAFYITAAATHSGNPGPNGQPTSPSDSFRELVEQSYFTKEVIENLTASTGRDFGQLMRGDKTNEEIIKIMIDKDPDARDEYNRRFYETILNVYKTLKSNG